MRYYIGIHVVTVGKKTTAVAVATEASDVLPDKYGQRETWEIRRLLPAIAQTSHSDLNIAVRAAIQRLYERMFIRRFISNPETCIPPTTIYVPKEIAATVDLDGRVLTTPGKHWTCRLAERVLL
jgi:hypothetical protein